MAGSTYTYDDVMQAIAFALEFAEDGAGHAALSVWQAGEREVEPAGLGTYDKYGATMFLGAGNIVHLSKEALRLVAQAQSERSALHPHRQGHHVPLRPEGELLAPRPQMGVRGGMQPSFQWCPQPLQTLARRPTSPSGAQHDRTLKAEEHHAGPHQEVKGGLWEVFREREVTPMTMTKKQLKALARHKRIVKERNENHNKPKDKRQMLFAPGASKSYRLYDI